MIALSGGCSSSCCYAPLSDIWVYTINRNEWTNVSVQSGTPSLPSARLYHGATSAATNNSFYIFGGNDIATGMLNDLWLLTLITPATPTAEWTAQWKLVNAGTGPQVPGVRAGHSQNALPSTSSSRGNFDGSFIIYGGESEESTLSDVWIYNATTFNQVTIDGSNVGPGARAQHAALIVLLPLPDGAGFVRALVISGGSDNDGNDLSDVWLLALNNNVLPSTWLKLGDSNSNVATGDSSWPSVRHGHSIWSAPTESGSSILSFNLFGGQNSSISDPSNFHNDTWSFSVTLSITSDGNISLSNGQEGVFQLINTIISPSPRALGGLVTDTVHFGNAIYASGFSGYNGGTDDRLHNDVWRITQS